MAQLLAPSELSLSFGSEGEGHVAGCDFSTPAPTLGEPPPITGCVTSFVVRPGHVDLDLAVRNMPAVAWLDVIACSSSTSCPGAVRAKPTPGPQQEPRTFSAQLPVTSLTGVTRFCGLVSTLQVGSPGGPGRPNPPSKIASTRLACLPAPGTFSQGAGAFRVTPEAGGLKLEGWGIDVTTDGPATLAFRYLTAGSPTTVLTAGLSEPQSTQRWPGFSAMHGFAGYVPYPGTAGQAALLVFVRRPPDPANPAGADVLVSSLYMDTTVEAFVPASVQQGAAMPVALRNVGASTAVTFNLLSPGGYFLRPWGDSPWTATAGPNGNLDLSIDSESLPPGRYRLAFSCNPQCAGSNLGPADLVGGSAWTRRMTLDDVVDVEQSGAPSLTTTLTAPEVLHVSGSGFAPEEDLRLLIVPNLTYAEGPPLEAATASYPRTDAQGSFQTDLDVSGFPLTGRPTQVIAIDLTDHPLTSALFTP